MTKAGKPRKYRNKIVYIYGIRFDSLKEGRRWIDLNRLQDAFHISGLKRQVMFRFKHNGIDLGYYKADFTYIKDGELVVEDVKGYKTPIYKLKKKLVKALTKIEILET